MSHTQSSPTPASGSHALDLAPRVAGHPVLGRINAWFFSAMDAYMHWKLGRTKERLFRDLPDRVVEIGAGTGANLRYLRPGTELVGIEPNVYMHDALRKNARHRGIAVDVRATGAERVDLPSDSVDAVISSLVLCTVASPEATLAEVRRVLRPGGRFLCVEHVAAPADGAVGRIQRAVHRPWAWFFEGCHTHRDLAGSLQRAGFRDLTIDRFTMRTAFVPVRPQIAAVAVK